MCHFVVPLSTKEDTLSPKVRNTREFNDIALSSGSDVVFVQGLRDSADNVRVVQANL